MKTKMLILIAILFLLSPFLVFGIHRYYLGIQRYRCGQNLKTLGLAHTVYSTYSHQEFQVTNGFLQELAADQPQESRFYSFTVHDIDSRPVPLSQYKGKVLLVVNVASQCGYTKQYAALQQLYETYRDRGFAVLAFPANNFGGQEPGSNPEIKNFCASAYKVTFPLFAKISVQGDDMDPLYQYLTSPAENGQFGKPVTWNFNKFLVDADGNTIGYFESKTDPLDPKILQAIEAALPVNDF